MTKTKAEREEYYGMDPPDLIKLCLVCRRASCKNCLAYMSRRKKEALVKRETSRKEG